MLNTRADLFVATTVEIRQTLDSDWGVGVKNRKRNLVVGIFISVLLLVGGLAYDYYRDTDYRSAFPQPDLTENAGSNEMEQGDYRADIGAEGNLVYILLLGIDRDDDRESMGVYRTDTIAVARLDLVNMNVRVLSIPRDTYTYVPVEGKSDKINHAYAFGSLQGNGPQESIKAVNNLLGKPVVNNYFLMDMEPIPAIVDEIGGVKVNVDMDIKGWGTTSIAKGEQILNGAQSDLYLRWRNSPGGDIDRIKHQQTFMGSLFKQQKDSGKLLETVQLVLENRDSIKTDLTLKQMIGLTRFSADLTGNSIEYSIIPGEAEMIKGISYWVMDEKEAPMVINDFLK